MAFKNTTELEVPAKAQTQPRENFGVYVPILLTGRRLITRENGIILKGDRLSGSTDESNAHLIAGQNRIPTKTVKRIRITDTESRLLNGIVVALKPVHDYRIDLDKLNMEVYDYASLEEMHTSVVEALPLNNSHEQESPEGILAKRQLAIVRALASLSLRV